MVKVIRAERAIHVPIDPEKPDSLYRPVQKGLLALVPEGFNLPKESYIDLGRVEFKKKKRNE